MSSPAKADRSSPYRRCVTSEDWLARLARLRTDVDKSVGEGVERRAPHRSPLLLCVLELIEDGFAADGWIALDAALVLRFQSFWKVVVARWPRRPDLRLPFHQLGNDGIWNAFTEEGRPSPHRSLTTSVALEPSFLKAAHSPEFRRKARAALIYSYFTPVEQAALCELTGIERLAAENEAQLIENQDTHQLLRQYDGKPRCFAASATLRPEPKFIRWHREHSLAK